MSSNDPEEARMLKELLETASSLNGYGVLCKTTLSQVKALCEPPPPYSPQQVVAIRTRIARMSQSVFAAMLNVSVSTVQKWESPTAGKPPHGAAVRLLQILESRGIEALIV
ncbi:helix-turn-helix domain-containing protein [Roseateles amylovorans]|jgi:putative transcriptional regulator|uniref:Transcriptional regulator n=1 Tax=Roseateles amylovorans TaxID=2978473 RepID=A0ABY6AZ45_9BURK|nr:transcriptional regulator [Roseateles amylovorans]UXH78446.1 transcriptional regulator [Roseateles amylovorans]